MDWRRSLAFLETAETADVDLILRKRGDHRLMAETDLQMLKAVLELLVNQVSGNVARSKL